MSLFTSFFKREKLWNLLQKVYFFDKNWNFDTKKDKLKEKDTPKRVADYPSPFSRNAQGKNLSTDGMEVPAHGWLERKSPASSASAVPPVRKMILETVLRLLGLVGLGVITPLHSMHGKNVSPYNQALIAVR